MARAPRWLGSPEGRRPRPRGRVGVLTPGWPGRRPPPGPRPVPGPAPTRRGARHAEEEGGLGVATRRPQATEGDPATAGVWVGRRRGDPVEVPWRALRSRPPLGTFHMVRPMDGRGPTNEKTEEDAWTASRWSRRPTRTTARATTGRGPAVERRSPIACGTCPTRTCTPGSPWPRKRYPGWERRSRRPASPATGFRPRP